MAMSPSQIAKLVEIASEWWPQFQPTAATADAWFLVLGEFDYEPTARAMREHLVSGEHYGKPDIGAIATKMMPQLADPAEVTAKIDEWYRRTDDVSRHPNREERAQFPVAAEVWDLVGGFHAMHNQSFAHQHIAKAYNTAIASVKARKATQNIGIEGTTQREIN